MATDEVLVARDGPVLTLTFNRPAARNALTWAMYEGLYRACEEVDADDAVRVLVLRGAGGKAFAAGTDIAQFTAFSTAEDGLRYERDLDRWVGRLGRVTKPVIAAIAGAATGGGFELAAACDLRLATPDARLGLPIARTLGNCVSMDAYARFLDLFGPSRLTELVFTARLLSATEAQAAGFVHEVVPAEELDARTRAVAAEIAEHAPLTLRITKEAIRRLQAARRLPDGEDLVALAYGSAAMVPLLTLGIPGSGTTAVLLGGFMMWGLRPGPLLFEKNPDFVWGLIASMYIGNVMLVILNMAFIPMFVRALKIPYNILMPLIIIFCITGAYSLNNKVWDVGQMLLFGVVGYMMRKLDYSPAALTLALVLGPQAERALRQSLIISDAGAAIFFQRPIAATLTSAALVAVAIPVARALWGAVARWRRSAWA